MTDTWTATNSGDWNTASNWSENVAPGSKDDYGDDVVIDTSGLQYIDLYNTTNSDYAYEINSLTVGSADEVSLVNGRMIIDSAATISGSLDIDQGFELDFESQDDVQTVQNTGTIFLAGSLYAGANQEVDLTGGGEVDLFGGSLEGIGLTGLESSNDIYGYGTINIYNLQNDSGGIIQAQGGTLTLQVSNAIVNYGELGATAANSTLAIDSSVNNIDGGYIIANTSGAEVSIGTNVITGGSLSAVDGGIIVGADSVLDGVTLTGTLEAESATGFGLADDTTISDDVIFEGTSGASIFLEGGNIVTDGNDAHFFNSTTLFGTGGIGDGMLILDNAGTIEASGGNLTLALSASDAGTNYNQGGGGQIIALKNSTVDIGAGDPNGSTFDNEGALIAYTGGQIVIGQGVDMTNFSGTDLQNGFYEAAGNGATLELNQYFSSFGATIVLSGAGSVIESNDESGGPTETLESMLKTIDQYAALEVVGARNYTATVPTFTVRGTLEMSNGIFQLAGGTSSRLNVQKGGLVTLEGKAGVALASGSKGYASIAKGGSLVKLAGGNTSIIGLGVANAGTITAGSGLLEFTGNVNGTGHDYVENAASLEFAGAFAKTQAFAFAKGGGKLILADAKQFAGTIAKVGAGDTIDVDGLGSGTTFTFVENAGKTQGVLTLKHGSTIDTLTLVGNYASAGFKLTSGKSSDTLVTYATPKAQDTPTFDAGQQHTADLAQRLCEAAFGSVSTSDGRGAAYAVTHAPEISADHNLSIVHPHV